MKSEHHSNLVPMSREEAENAAETRRLRLVLFYALGYPIMVFSRYNFGHEFINYYSGKVSGGLFRTGGTLGVLLIMWFLSFYNDGDSYLPLAAFLVAAWIMSWIQLAIANSRAYFGKSVSRETADHPGNVWFGLILRLSPALLYILIEPGLWFLAGWVIYHWLNGKLGFFLMLSACCLALAGAMDAAHLKRFAIATKSHTQDDGKKRFRARVNKSKPATL